MPVGIQVRGIDNVLQIDGDYRNLFFKRAGRTPIGGSVTFPAVLPAVFMRPLTSDLVIDYLRPAGGGTYQLKTLTPVEYYVFDVPAAQTFGANVYDDTGRLVFNAIERPLDVLAAVTLPNSPSYTYSGLPSGKYAYSVTYARTGSNPSYEDAGSGLWWNEETLETLVPTARGFSTQFLPISAWLGAPMYDDTFYDFSGPRPVVTIIDVAGIPT